MSFDRQRAMSLSAASMFRAGRPAAARAWLVRVARSCSSADEKALGSQAKAALGVTIVRARAATMASPARDRRGRPAGAWRGARLTFMAPGTSVRWSLDTRLASTEPDTHHARPEFTGRPRLHGPGSLEPRYHASPPDHPGPHRSGGDGATL